MADRPNNRGRKSRKKVCGFCVDKVAPPCNWYLRKTSA